MESYAINTNRKGVDETDDSEQEITNGAVLIKELSVSAGQFKLLLNLGTKCT